jgi:hypothetical protein
MLVCGENGKIGRALNEEFEKLLLTGAYHRLPPHEYSSHSAAAAKLILHYLSRHFNSGW